MSERHFMRGFWGTREESAEQCARRTLQMLQDFRGIHELLASWYETGWSREEALETRIELSHESLVQIFHDNLFQPVHLRIGYSIDWWNGADDTCAMSIGLVVGGRAAPSSCNTMLLYLPSSPEVSPEMFRPDILEATFTAMIKAWEPDWASVLTGEFIKCLSPEGDRPWMAPDVAWLTYLNADRLHDVPDEVPCEDVVELPGLGTLFVLTRDHLVSADNPDDIAAARALLDVLERAGALEPIPTSWDDRPAPAAG